MEHNSSRYRDLVTDLARQCLHRAAGAPVLAHAPGASVSLGLAAARVLLGDPPPDDLVPAQTTLAQAARSASPARFNDTFGFSRPVYHPLLVHLHLRAAAALVSPGTVSPPPPPRPLTPSSPRTADIPLTLWWALCRYQSASPPDIAAARRTVQSILDHPGPDGALHPRLPDDQLDAWTYRELTALHALAHLAQLDRSAPWRDRVHQIAQHHQAFTQPDFTTYQPWAVFAFLSFPDTAMFGEQQLHDTQTNLHVETAGAGAIAALLLADAADAMDAG